MTRSKLFLGARMTFENKIEVNKEEIALILANLTTPEALKTMVAFGLLAVIAFVAWLYFGKPGT